MEHLIKIFAICKLTPTVKHWMPTREAQFLKDIKPKDVPKNLIIRMSSHMVASRARENSGLTHRP